MFLIDNSSKKPLYIQLYDYLRELIIDGILAPGYRLPSTRKMAEDFFISRNTVENAYSQLCMDGFIESRIGSGFFVLDINSQKLNLDCMPISKILELKNVSPQKRVEEKYCPYDFFYKGLTTGNFPQELYLNYVRDIIMSDRNEHFKFIDCHAGEISLRQEIAGFLRIQRGVHCDPEQIVLCPGLPHAFALIGQLFPDDKKLLAMEEPGHDIARRAFINGGFQITPVPVTNAGIDVNKLKETNANLSFVMPSHQYPLGGSMPVNKRFEILQWLDETDSYLVEHDFDCFLKYHERPVPSIQGLSDGNRVFHVNTLEKLLFPNTYMCYLVIPPAFVDPYIKKFSNLHNTISGLEQQVFHRLLQDGQFEKYLRRLAIESLKKHDILIEELSKSIGKKGIIGGHNAGTHITVRFCDGSKASERIKEAAEVGVKVYSIEDYYFDKNSFKDDTVLIGWNKISSKDLIKGIKLLCNTWFNNNFLQIRCN